MIVGRRGVELVEPKRKGATQCLSRAGEVGSQFLIYCANRCRYSIEVMNALIISASM
jgi:hypothetical protein